MLVFLTSQSLWVCTKFIYHVSDFVYVHLMRDLSLVETLLVKAAMEKVMAKAVQSVNRYHAKNCRFADNGFADDINSK